MNSTINHQFLIALTIPPVSADISCCRNIHTLSEVVASPVNFSSLRQVYVIEGGQPDEEKSVEIIFEGMT